MSAERILTFLALDEMEDYIDKAPSDDQCCIRLNAVSMSWVRGEANLESQKESDSLAQNDFRSVHTLANINLTVSKGSLVAVVGPVGSGKSSLLNGLLGELILKEGSVRVHGSVAYCDQRAWILNATIKDNILFGLPYEKERFDRA